MPLTEFAGGEDYLLGASRAGKRGKQQVYAALTKMRSDERQAAQKIIDEQNKTNRRAGKYQANKRFSGLAERAGIKYTGPKKITFEDVEEGNLSTEDYNDLSARFSGQDPRVTRGLRVADALGLTSAARTLFGKDSPYAGAGGRAIGEVLSRIMPDNKYKYTFDEYGQNVGTGAYTTKPSSTDPLIAATIATPAKGFSPAMRSLIGTAKAIDKSVPRPVTAGILGGTGVAAGVLAQPEEARAFNPKKFAKLLDEGNPVTLNDYARKQAKAITSRARRRIWENLYPDTPWEKRPAWAKGKNWYNDPRLEGTGMSDSITREDVLREGKAFVEEYKDTPLWSKIAGTRIPMSGPRGATAHWGHDIPLESGGTLREGGFIPADTNLGQGTRTFDELISDEMLKSQLKGKDFPFFEIANRLGITHLLVKNLKNRGVGM
jgi:hypothetical protein